MIKEIINSLLKELDNRQMDIIVGRFGLGGSKITLAGIGGKYHLTRERIRQIEAAVLDLLRKKAKSANSDFSAAVLNLLKKGGGIAKEDDFLNDLKDLFKEKDAGKWDIRFLLEVFGEPKFYRADKNFYDFWYLEGEVLDIADNFIDKLVDVFKKNKEEILAGNKKTDELFSDLTEKMNLGEKTARNYISVSKKLKINSYGDFGLSDWEEINPKTIRAKTNLILRKSGKPMHFRQIAEEINKIKFGGRPALPQTVHNELIKDTRFVLVGRGMYGLSELGVKPGTAKEVIARILKEKGPLPKDKVVNLVLQERFLKENTILLNLQNKKHFKKLPDGRYHLA